MSKEDFNKNDLLIINSSGGLVFSTIKTFETNELLVIASTIHSLMEMSNHIFEADTEMPSLIEFERHKIEPYKTIGGYTFVFIWKDKKPSFLPVYHYFCENVLQNYNYKLEMPISEEDFDVSQFL